MRINEKKYVILGSLCALLITMTVAYAAFQTNLKVKGTSNITSNWDVRITNVVETNKNGEAETVGNPTWTETTANIEANLYDKEDYIEYDVTVENKGTLDAKLEGINETLKEENKAVKISIEGYTKGQKLEKGTSQIVKVKIEYNPEFTGEIEEGSTEISLDLNYTQNDDYKKDESGEVTSPDRYLVTYDCTTNGGEKCTNFNEYLKEGEPVNLTNQGTNKKKKFIGWNTDPKAKEGITELQMGTEEITLYAIYEGDPIIQSWGETSDTDFHSSLYKQSIISAEFLDNKNIPENATESWDISAAKDGSVMAWVIPDTTDNTKHHLYIGGNGGIIANEDSSNLFRGFSIIETIQFHKNFDTSNTTNMAAMFNSSTNLSVLDLSNFDTKNVTNMAAMFTYCISLTSLDLSSFDTSKVTDMQYMFGTFSYKYPMNLEKIKFGNKFKTDNVTNMRNMFYYCVKLTKLNLCSFNTSKVTNMVVMFAGTTSLEKVYVGSNWVTTNADTTDMWSNSKISSVTKSDNCEVEAEDPATINVSTTSTTKSITIVVDAKAESGIAKYEYQIDDGQWIESTDNIYTFTGLESNTGYSIKVRVTSKVGKQTTAEVKNNPLEGIETTFAHKTTEQTFTVPQKGIYKLEVWGAQGGPTGISGYDGGYGGYSVGEITLYQNQNLYINVGGQGSATGNGTAAKAAGGYNGGGQGITWENGTGRYLSSGGGATHIATKSGLLSTLGSNKNDILIVSGGGGGSGYHTNTYRTITVGHAGGYIGNQSTSTYDGSNRYASGGTQTAAGSNGQWFGSFGQGASGTSESGGGGGGYYGGNAVRFSAGGGSGYIGNPKLTNKVMYCYSCQESNKESTKTISTTNVSSNPISNYAKTGSGYAKITLLETKIATSILDIPTFEEVEKDNEKEVTIIYPEGCGKDLTCSYQKDDGEWTETTDTNTKLIFTESGNVVAKATDGTNEVTASHTVIYEGNQLDYSGKVQTFTADKDGYYKIELWGAQGGNKNIYIGGKGAYTSGEIYLETGDKLYIYIGSQAEEGTDDGGYNGGGSLISGENKFGSPGGGATDVRLVNGAWNDKNSLNSRIMVAAGGGGANYRSEANYGEGNGGAGGTLIGINGVSLNNSNSYGYSYGLGGTQTIGGSAFKSNAYIQSLDFPSGAFGNGAGTQSGSGSGYYGGGSSMHGGAGGGSSYISGYAGVNSITSESDRTHTNQTKHYSDKYFINTEMKAGVNSGDGKAKITYLKTPSSKDSTKIKGVRYIKDCINGTNISVYNHWVELQAINNGVNIAKGKTITATSPINSTTGAGKIEVVVDGKADDATQYANPANNGMQCVTVDLGKEYDLEEIAVWHYFDDGRTYYNNSTQVAGENGVYRTVYNGDTVATSDGNRIRKDSNLSVKGKNINIGYTKGGTIELSKSKNTINITATPTTDFTYQGATLVCDDKTTKGITGKTFNISDCEGDITVYPKWKKNDRKLVEIDKLPQQIAFTQDLVDVSGSFVYDTSRYYYRFIVDNNITRLQASSTSAVDVTDYETLYTNLWCSSDSLFMIGLISNRGTWVHNAIVSSKTVNMSGTVISLPISSISGKYYLSMERLKSDAVTSSYCNVHVVALDGKSYSYTNPF